MKDARPAWVTRVPMGREARRAREGGGGKPREEVARCA